MSRATLCVRSGATTSSCSRTASISITSDRQGLALIWTRLAGLSPASAGTVRVGLVATYARWKGHETFVRALAQLAARLPIRGYIVGSPVYRSTAAQVRDEELRALAQSMGVTAHLGFVPFQSDPAAVYRALDIVVHASTSPEPFGLVVAEAMACGRAVVATTLGGVAEVADEDVASLHIAGDAGDLARAIWRCVNDEGTRASLGATARARAEQRFSLVRFTATTSAGCIRKRCGARE